MLLSLEYLSLNKIVYFIEFRWSITRPVDRKCRNPVLQEIVNNVNMETGTVIVITGTQG